MAIQPGRVPRCSDPDCGLAPCWCSRTHGSTRTNGHTLQGTDIVMAVTTHMAGDNSLVNNAAGFTNDDGTLWLAHVEDEKGFGRFIDAISKIDAIDTDTARERISRPDAQGAWRLHSFLQGGNCHSSSYGPRPEDRNRWQSSRPSSVASSTNTASICL